MTRSCLLFLLLLSFGCASASTRTLSDGGRPGACVARPESCNDSDDDCDGDIDEDFDLRSDRANCGRCGLSCPVEGSCVDGRCHRPASGICTPVDEVCNGRDDSCEGDIDEGFDLNTNPAHCGLCNLRCGADQSCSAGHCTLNALPSVCVTSAEVCNGKDDDCDRQIDEGFNLLTDSANCGICGRRCDAEATCVNGRCTLLNPVPAGDCADGETCNGIDDDCDGVIDESFDLLSDVDHCGLCGRRCSDTQSCFNGRCQEDAPVLNCVAATEVCNNLDDDCDGVVDDSFDLLTDPLNCGLCGRACAPGDNCVSGHCAHAAPVSGCVSANEICNNLDDDCDGLIDETIDLLNDCSHCGVCGRSCGEGQQCRNGRCTLQQPANQCVATEERCNGRDDDCDGVVDDGFDLLTDRDHCGICGRACAAGQVCTTGRCAQEVPSSACVPSAESCNNADDDCNGIVDDPFDLLTDTANCGVCGRVCGAGQSCENGRCRQTVPVSACQPGPESCNNVDDDCDGVIDNGFDLLNDRDHCGSCGQSCGVGQACNAGRCSASLRIVDADGTLTLSFAPDVVLLGPDVVVTRYDPENPCSSFTLEDPTGDLPPIAGGDVLVFADGTQPCRVAREPGAAAGLSRAQSSGIRAFFGSVANWMCDVVTDAGGVRRFDTGERAMSLPAELSVDAQVSGREVTAGLKAGASATSLRVQASGELDIVVESCSIKKLAARVDRRTVTTVTPFLEVNGDLTPGFLQSLKLEVGPKAVPVGGLFAGPVPVLVFFVTPELEVGPVELSLKGEFAVALSSTSSVTYNMTGLGSGWTLSRTQSTSSSITPSVDISLAASLPVELEVELAAKVLGLAGPEMEVELGVEIEYEDPGVIGTPAPSEVKKLTLQPYIATELDIAVPGLPDAHLTKARLDLGGGRAFPLEDCGSGECCDMSPFFHQYRSPSDLCGVETSTTSCDSGSGCGLDGTVNRYRKECSGTGPLCPTSGGGRLIGTQPLSCGATTTCSTSSSACVACNACTPNDHQDCSGSDVFWFDSCGNQGTRAADCTGTQTCIDNGQTASCCTPSCASCRTTATPDGCGGTCAVNCATSCSGGTCSSCTSNDHQDCSGGDVYWFDSCGNQGARAADCTGTQTCVDSGQSASCCTPSCGSCRTSATPDGCGGTCAVNCSGVCSGGSCGSRPTYAVDGCTGTNYRSSSSCAANCDACLNENGFTATNETGCGTGLSCFNRYQGSGINGVIVMFMRSSSQTAYSTWTLPAALSGNYSIIADIPSGVPVTASGCTSVTVADDVVYNRKQGSTTAATKQVNVRSAQGTSVTLFQGDLTGTTAITVGNLSADGTCNVALLDQIRAVPY